eukprot:53194_1
MAETKEATVRSKPITMVNDTNKKVWLFRNDPFYKEIAIDMDDGPQLNDQSRWSADVTFKQPIYGDNIYLEPLDHLLQNNHFFRIHEYIISNIGPSSTWSARFSTWYKGVCSSIPGDDIDINCGDVMAENDLYYHITSISEGIHLLYFRTNDNIYRKSLTIYSGKQIDVNGSIDDNYTIKYSKTIEYDFTENMSTEHVTRIIADAPDDAHTIINILQHQRIAEYTKEVQVAMKGSKKDLVLRNVGKMRYKFFTTLSQAAFENYIIINGNDVGVDIAKKNGAFRWNWKSHEQILGFDEYLKNQHSDGPIYVYAKSGIYYSGSNRLHIKGYVVQDITVEEELYVKGIDIVPEKDLESCDQSDSESEQN